MTLSPSAPPDRRPSGDHALLPFLVAVSEADAAEALAEILGGAIAQVTRDVVWRELGASPTGSEHAEDVLADARARLVRKLWRLREPDATGEPIDNLLAYGAVVAEHACYAFLRAQFPERTRLRNRVRYAVSHHPSLSLTRDGSGAAQCQSRGTTLGLAGSTLRFLDDPQGWTSGHRIAASLPLPALIEAVLSRLDRPVPLDRLVDALAPILGVTDAPALGREAAREVADPAPGAVEVLERRESLVRVWEEIVALPARQRAALLLNLRDPEGAAVLPLLIDTGIVSMARLADAAGVGAEEFAGLWGRLPLDDLAVSARLGITRQQVINLRKAARARLMRRLVIRPPSSRRLPQVESSL